MRKLPGSSPGRDEKNNRVFLLPIRSLSRSFRCGWEVFLQFLEIEKEGMRKETGNEAGVETFCETGPYEPSSDHVCGNYL